MGDTVRAAAAHAGHTPHRPHRSTRMSNVIERPQACTPRMPSGEPLSGDTQPGTGHTVAAYGTRTWRHVLTAHRPVATRRSLSTGPGMELGVERKAGPGKRLLPGARETMALWLWRVMPTLTQGSRTAGALDRVQGKPGQPPHSSSLGQAWGLHVGGGLRGQHPWITLCWGDPRPILPRGD